MSPSKKTEKKTQALKKHGCFNININDVKDPFFLDSDFFDAQDLIQVKYEMVRRVRVEEQSVQKSAKDFGFSRPSFYQTKALLEKGGIAALIPQKKGPRRSHKLDANVVDFLQQKLLETPSLRSSDLANLVLKHFGRSVHPRSVERALERQKKKQ